MTPRAVTLASVAWRNGAYAFDGPAPMGTAEYRAWYAALGGEGRARENERVRFIGSDVGNAVYLRRVAEMWRRRKRPAEEAEVRAAVAWHERRIA